MTFCETRRVLLAIVLVSLSTMELANANCQESWFGPGQLVCVCNLTNCDSGLKFEWPLQNDVILRLSSNKAGARFQQTRIKLKPKNGPKQQEKLQEEEAGALIRLEINKHYQKITGFGGGITDSAASLIMQLDERVRDKLIEDYFGPTGLNYNLARVPIGGTDMSSRAYSYDDLPNWQTDFNLNHFALQPEDLKWKIPLIKLIEERRSRPLKLLTACWSPPAWMKDNQHLVQGNLKLIEGQGLATNPYYATYARYIIRFLEEYARHNVTFWALSAQNEPRSPARNGPAIIHHNSINFTPNQLTALYKDHLLPQLRNSSFKLHHFVWDDVVEEIDNYLSVMFAERSIREQVSGVALHWYSQGLREKPFVNVERAFNKMPHNFAMISTEASYLDGQKPGSWAHGSGYARDLIRTLRTGFIGWLDWNLALDKEGGPTWAQNPLDSALQIDLARQTYIKNPMFYALAHVTRFMPPNSTILKSSVIPKKDNDSESQVYSLAAELDTILLDENKSANGFKSDQLARKISLVLLNTSDRVRSVRLQLLDCKLKRQFDDLQLELASQSVQSFAFLC